MVGYERGLSNSNFRDACYVDSRNIPAGSLRLGRGHPKSTGGLSAKSCHPWWIRIHCTAKCLMLVPCPATLTISKMTDVD